MHHVFTRAGGDFRPFKNPRFLCARDKSVPIKKPALKRAFLYPACKSSLGLRPASATSTDQQLILLLCSAHPLQPDRICPQEVNSSKMANHQRAKLQPRLRLKLQVLHQQINPPSSWRRPIRSPFPKKQPSAKKPAFWRVSLQANCKRYQEAAGAAGPPWASIPPIALIDRRRRPFSSASMTLTFTTWPTFSTSLMLAIR